MTNSVIVAGAGGHAKVAIEILRASGYPVEFCVGNDNSPAMCMGVPVLKGDEQLEQLRKKGYGKIFIAIGENTIRQTLAKIALKLNYQWVNAVSPYAIISPSASLGMGVAIMAGVVINADCFIGDLAIINTGAIVDHDCQIGEGAHIAPQCALAGNVTIGANAFLGVGCKVVPGVHIGDDATIGAGAVVIDNIPRRVVAVGVPAKVIKNKDEEKTGEKR